MKKVFTTATEQFTFTVDLGGFTKKKAFTFLPKGEEKWSSACVRELSLWGSQMNVEKITSTGIRLYSFDMLGNHTKHLLRFDKIELGNTVDQD